MKAIMDLYKLGVEWFGEEPDNYWFKVAKSMNDVAETGKLTQTIKAPPVESDKPNGKPPVPFIAAAVKNKDKTPYSGNYNPYKKGTTRYFAYKHMRDCLRCELKYHGNPSFSQVDEQLKIDRAEGRI